MYDFVPTLNKLSKKELKKLRLRPSGSHTDIMLKECLLDSDYNKSISTKKARKKCVLMTSFIDINPWLSNYSDEILIRSEFLILRFIGDKKFSFAKQKEYMKFLSEKIIPYQPKKIIYRLCDYNNEDFSFLPEDKTSRGAKRLIDVKKLLKNDIKVIRLLQSHNIFVKILIPYVVFSDEFENLRKIIKNEIQNVPIGVMLETPASVLETEKYLKADFFIYGPGDLTKNIYGGLNRNNPEYSKTDKKLILPMIRESLNTISKSKKQKTVYFVKNLINEKFKKYRNIKKIPMLLSSDINYNK